MRLTLEKKIISGFIGALFLLVIIAYLSYQSTKHLTENVALAEHTQKVLASLESLMSDLTDVEAGERGFVITGQASYLDPYEQNIIESAVSFRRLRELTADNPAQQRRLDTLALLLAARLDAARLVVEVRRTHGFTAAQREILTGKGKRLHDEIRGLITDMKQEENNLLQKREEKTKSSSQSTQTVIVLGSLGAILLVGAALFIISRGFNQLKQAEEMLLRKNQELRVATERAQAADHIKSAFLAAMSHELRTPLNSIIGFTSIILQGLAGPLNAEQRKQLQMVQNSSRHLLALINDVLDISKIEAGQLEVTSEPFDLNESITKVVGIVTPLAEKKGLALHVQLASGLGEIVGDQRRVEQILLNLLTNAIKFTERGVVTLSAELTADSQLPGKSRQAAVQLRVSDTGIGIHPEDLATLFQPFRQIDSALSRHREGTGLGLAICRRLADLMGAEIRGESVWEKGSTFIFTLPLQRWKEQ